MKETQQDHRRPSVFRHLAVMTYDSLFLLSILLLATLVAVALNGGNSIENNNPFFMLYLIGICHFFYGWFWTHGGQTLGMRAWKVHLVGNQQHDITWTQAFIRIVVAIISWIPAGMGYWWQWLGQNKQTWPDYFSGTRLHFDQSAKTKSLSKLS